MVSEALSNQGRVRADDWVRAAADAVAGTGGGKATMAQAGAKDPDRLVEALRAGEAWIREKLDLPDPGAVK
jgi:alanyl-tRNA synthetase